MMRQTRRTRTINIEPLEARLVLAPLIVSTLADESDGNFSPGDLSLREAVFLSNNSAGDRITFAPQLAGKTIQLLSEITITNHVDIQSILTSKRPNILQRALDSRIEF